MTIVKEVADGVKMISGGIEQIRTIHQAIKDGVDYIEKRHPDIKGDLAAMCTEMRKTLTAVATASAIITHFRFTVAGPAMVSEPARFNEHLIAHKLEARNVEDQLDALRGHCGIIKDHADELDKKASKAGLTSLFKLVGVDSEDRERELVSALRHIYEDEMRFHDNVFYIRTTLEEVLRAVEDELGSAGSMEPKNVPKAAAVLGEYADIFSELESRANYSALELQRLIDRLNR